MADAEHARQVRVYGEAARELLALPAYTLILNTLSDQYLKELIETPPGPNARDKRDHAHMMIHTLKALNEAVQGHARDLLTLETMGEQEDPE